MILSYRDKKTEAFARGNRPVRLLGLGVKLEPLNAASGVSEAAHPRTRQLRLRLN